MKKHARKYPFSQRTVKEYNILSSTDCVLGGGYINLNMFKNIRTQSSVGPDTRSQTAALSIRRKLSRPLAFSVAILFNLVEPELKCVYCVLHHSCSKYAS